MAIQNVQRFYATLVRVQGHAYIDMCWIMSLLVYQS